MQLNNLTQILGNNTLNITNTSVVNNVISFFKQPSVIPSLTMILIVLVFIFAIVKIGLKIFGSFEQFLSKYTVPILILGSMYLLIPIYSSTHLPQLFVKQVYNETTNTTMIVPDQEIISHINSEKNLAPNYWDLILYYGTLKGLSEEKLLLPFLLLFGLFFYLSFLLLSKYTEKLAPILAFILLLIFTGGGLGILSIITNFDKYPLFSSIFVLSMLLYYLYLLFK